VARPAWPGRRGWIRDAWTHRTCLQRALCARLLRVDDFVSYWSDLPAPWRRCLHLAWESLSEGSVPVGSVITDGSGAIVAEGRNRAFGDPPPGPGLGGTYVAHAEINALASLPPGDYPDHTIWSSLEPCFMCSAAIFHSHVGTARYAAADPLMAGVSDLPDINDWVRSRWPDRVGPLAGPLGIAAGALHQVWHLRRKPEGVVAVTLRDADPGIAEVAVRMAASGPDTTLAQTLGGVWDDLVALAWLQDGG